MASVCAVACPFLGLASAPVWGLSCEACVLTLSYVHSCTYTWPYVHSLARLPGHVGILADVNVNKLYIYIANQSVTSLSHWMWTDVYKGVTHGLLWGRHGWLGLLGDQARLRSQSGETPSFPDIPSGAGLLGKATGNSSDQSCTFTRPVL